MKSKILLSLALSVSIMGAVAQKNNVGIGTTKPDQSAALEVSSTTQGFLPPRVTLQQRNSIQNPATGLMVYQSDFLAGTYQFDGKEWKTLGVSASANSVADAFNWGLTGNAGTTDNNYVGTSDNRPVIFRTNTASNTVYNERMRIGANGNVGIGTTTPSELLEVAGNIKGNILSSGTRTYLVGKDGGGFHWFAASPSVSEPGNIMMGIQRDPSTDVVTDLFLAPAGNFSVRVAGTKVLIGDAFSMTYTSNDYSLFVSKGMITEKIKVAVKNTGEWSDYVFDPSYKKMSLESVEKFVKENKHLPNMPSDKEMVESGLDVGKSTAKLLEKIEELTLYMIDLNNEVKSLKAENSKLKNK